jgi:putative redox protein
MQLTLTRLNENLHLEATTEKGLKIQMDSGDNLAASPMELLLASVAGCSSIDVISILKKQRQIIHRFDVEITGERIQVDEAKPFKSVTLVFKLTGEIDAAKAYRAAELSFTKYCSVSKTLDGNVDIKYSVVVNGTTVA